MKPREIWMPDGSYLLLHTKPSAQQEEVAKKFGGYIHWREVVPIDWDNIWDEVWAFYDDGTPGESCRKLIQELVEKQLAGDDETK